MLSCSKSAEIVRFATISDAHVRNGDMRFVPDIVNRINVLKPLPDCVVSLGDNIYGRTSEDLLADAQDYHAEMARLQVPHYYVIGNHEAAPIEERRAGTWQQLLATWEMPGRWYDFTVKGVHFIVLDTWRGLNETQYRETLDEEITWLKRTLAASSLPAVLLLHEAIGWEQADSPHWIATDNTNFWPEDCAFERVIAANSQRLLAVFEGHKHKSLFKVQHSVPRHLVSASFLHDGQFARIFLATDRRCLVIGNPKRDTQNAEERIQQSYGEWSLLEDIKRCVASVKSP